MTPEQFDAVPRTTEPMVDTPESAATKARSCGPAALFRTVLCKQFEERGSCRYGDACMFAHGSDAIRTVAQNEADGVTTKEGVFCFLRAQRKRERLTKSPIEEQQRDDDASMVTTVPAPGCGKNAAKNKRKREAAKRARQALAGGSETPKKEEPIQVHPAADRKTPDSDGETVSTTRSYRHDPYSRPPTPPSQSTPMRQSPPMVPAQPAVAATPSPNTQFSPLVLWASRGALRPHAAPTPTWQPSVSCCTLESKSEAGSSSSRHSSC